MSGAVCPVAATALDGVGELVDLREFRIRNRVRVGAGRALPQRALVQVGEMGADLLDDFRRHVTRPIAEACADQLLELTHG